MNNELNLNIQIAKCVKGNSREDSLITVFGNKNIIYLLSDRMPASKYSYQFPIGTIEHNIMDEYFNEIEVNNPEIVVLYNEYEKIDVYDDLARMNEFVKYNNYILLEEYANVKVYKK